MLHPQMTQISPIVFNLRSSVKSVDSCACAMMIADTIRISLREK
jgi:hypothetical protein